MEADQKQVFIAASHRGGTVTLYLSDATGQFYVKSLDHVVAFVHQNNFLLDLYEVLTASMWHRCTLDCDKNNDNYSCIIMIIRA